MFEIKVIISCPDLVAAAEMLVKALRPAAAESEAPAEPKKTTKRGSKAKQEVELVPNAMEEPAPQQPVVLPMPQAMAQPQVMPQQPFAQPQPLVQPQPMMQPPQTMPPQQPVMQPVMQPPVTGAPGYTAEQISRAGAELVQTDPTKMQALLAMLQQFGVATIQMLKPEQFGAFANGLRSLGARL